MFVGTPNAGKDRSLRRCLRHRQSSVWLKSSKPRTLLSLAIGSFAIHTLYVRRFSAAAKRQLPMTSLGQYRPLGFGLRQRLRERVELAMAVLPIGLMFCAFVPVLFREAARPCTRP